jgi:hypothetical protein
MLFLKSSSCTHLPHASHTRMFYWPAAPSEIWNRFPADFCSYLLHFAADSLTMSAKSNEKLRSKRSPKFRNEIENYCWFRSSQTNSPGLAIAQAISRPGSTQVKTCGICGRQSGTGEDVLRVRPFHLPILNPSNSPYSSIIRGWYDGSIGGRRTKWTQSHPMKIKKAISRHRTWTWNTSYNSKNNRSR